MAFLINLRNWEGVVMAKRTKYEVGGNEEEYVFKCMKCVHSYVRKEESDVLLCSLKECRFQEPKIRLNDRK